MSGFSNLELLTEYRNRKGFRESIDAYIEEHIPLVEKQSGTYILKYLHNSSEQNSPLLPSSCLDLHKKLLTLKWNNIFTTNYDNSIECAYTDKQNELEETYKQVQELECKIEENNVKIENETRKVNKKETANTQRAEDEKSNLNTDDESLNSSTDIISKLEIENEKLAFEVKLWKRKIETENINIVKHSSDLQIQKNRNIIKLHGSIPENKSVNFEFDGDIHKRYVISKKDYSEYPQKHEAFTQLMRISLLQDAFCLIGFSGVDPNFIAWISWVRDIIERKTNGSQIPDYKIYRKYSGLN